MKLEYNGTQDFKKWNEANQRILSPGDKIYAKNKARELSVSLKDEFMSGISHERLYELSGFKARSDGASFIVLADELAMNYDVVSVSKGGTDTSVYWNRGTWLAQVSDEVKKRLAIHCEIVLLILSNCPNGINLSFILSAVYGECTKRMKTAEFYGLPEYAYVFAGTQIALHYARKANIATMDDSYKFHFVR